ncbi:MAG TPA: FMN-binding glutamate synthase family protein, partial [Limnochordia bacterium]|nr:FMN-binding glutamate synthase family protein [Limnochordia bacterium]
ILYKGKRAKRFDAKLGGKHLGNYLISATEEIKEGVRALGKHALHQVNSLDLVSLDEQTSQVTGIPLAYKKTTYSNGKVRAILHPGRK